MIEKKILTYLGQALHIPVLPEWQEGLEVPCVIFEKTGGTEENFLKTDTIALQVYGRNLEEAAKLGTKVSETMADFPKKDGDVSACRKNTETNDTDTETKRYRYQVVFEVIYFE